MKQNIKDIFYRQTFVKLVNFLDNFVIAAGGHTISPPYAPRNLQLKLTSKTLNWRISKLGNFNLLI